MKTREKLKELRRKMEKAGVHAYLVPSTDPHQSEYVPDPWRRRAWISGFTGSAGDVVVTSSDAGLWTDGRYFLQAERELSRSGVRLFRMGEKGVSTPHAWLAEKLRTGQIVGVDPQVISIGAASELESTLGKSGIRVRFLEKNLVDGIWSDRPEPSSGPIRIHPDKLAGETVRSKLRRLRKEMKARDAQAHVLASLDAIAWLYNIRGEDLPYNPMVIAYAVVTPKEAFLFTRPEKADKAARKALGHDVTVRPYDAFARALAGLGRRRVRVWIDPAASSRWMADQLRGADLVQEASPVFLMKARKNKAEIRGMKSAHVRDGVAMVRFLRWLEAAVPEGGITEVSAGEMVDRLRARGSRFRGPSFDTISGYGEHGAIIHYSATEETDVPLKAKGIYLIDSGGQYDDGTTDITRTVLLGKKATPAQRMQFTRVLKGHIALARVRFPSGVRGLRLDTLARVPLWEAGLDYRHGTGHGVGAHLSVHEGPQSISGRDTGAPLEAGNILSNEPGYYEEGSHGIRIENLILVVEDKDLSGNGTPWLRFETITRCPIDKRLIEPRLLTPEETAWLNDYHRQVLDDLAPRMSPVERLWLRKACAPIPRAR